MPAGVSISASPPESSKARFQRPSAAITRRASARSGVTSAADLFRCRASRIATAIASASISGLAASMTARFVMPARSSRRSRARPAVDAIARSRWTAASPRTPAPRVRAAPASPRISTSPRLMPKRVSSACIANCGWFDAGGVVNLPLRVPDAADRFARRRRRDRYRAPAAPPRLAAALATAWRNFAVAGIDPVEPAAITGPS